MATAERPPTENAARPFQFTLRQLLILMGIVGVLCAGYSWMRDFPALGEMVGVVVVFAFVVTMLHLTTDVPPVQVGVAVLTVMLAFGWLMPGLGPHSPEPSRRMQCSHHLKHIGIALHNYHDVYGSFPPAYIADANGKPMHSWRVLILPFLEQKPLYDSYSFDEPWDGPNNRKLHDVLVATYRCPTAHDKQPPWETSYVAIVGSQTMWPGEKATKLGDLADGTSNTLMVTEVLNSGIHWMEPRDLHVVQTPMLVNPNRGAGISSLHSNCVVALFADGHTQSLTNSTPAEVIRALLTIDGSEKVVVE